MKYAVFLGCTIPARARNYEMSAMRVAERLGIEFTHINDFACCGFPVRSTKQAFADALAARNLGIAESQGLDICVLCSACSAVLAEVNHAMKTDPARNSVINHHLEAIGRSYHGTVSVRHLTRILFEDIGIETIRKHLKFDLTALFVAPHYGCHYLKPSDAHGAFDDPEHPSSIGELIRATGASAVDLDRKHCCGGAVLAVNNDITYRLAAQKLESATHHGSDCMCVICPFCSVIYDDNQKPIEQHLSREFDLPVLYLTQLIGLAMGFDPKELGLNMNKVKAARILEKIESRSHHES